MPRAEAPGVLQVPSAGSLAGGIVDMPTLVGDDSMAARVCSRTPIWAVGLFDVSLPRFAYRDRIAEPVGDRQHRRRAVGAEDAGDLSARIARCGIRVHVTGEQVVAATSALSGVGVIVRQILDRRNG